MVEYVLLWICLSSDYTRIVLIDEAVVRKAVDDGGRDAQDEDV